MYQFTEDCLIGIEQIDEEHKELFEMLNEVEQLLMDETEPAEVAVNLILALKKYASEHFAHEEAYMEKIRDPELQRQRKEHEAFKAKLNQMELAVENEEKGKKVLISLLEYMARWLYHHILGSDIMIGKITPAGKKIDESLFDFSERYRTGIAFIDGEHKQLFEIIGRVHEVVQAEYLHDKYDEIVGILQELEEYTEHHFYDEEIYMEEIGYAGLGAQKRAHQAFINRLKEINLEDVDDHQETYLEELTDFLLNWLIQHILKMDKKIPKH